ncbi:MAG: sigma 54-interacting transcriptional regulator [Alicyclobacillus sp.]|nr:sigma 54-interacting transcriptional regulator [Alicyclobacillus sp.]
MKRSNEFGNNKMFHVLDVLDVLDTPMFVVDSTGNVVWVNRSGQATIFTDWEPDFLARQLTLPTEYAYVEHKGVPRSDLTLIECIPLPQPDPEEVRTLQEENDELEELINSSLDEWYVTDGQGITIRVNEKVEQLYGPLVGGLKGKSVFDLERQKIFYPSVSAMVIRHRSQQTVLQYTIDGRRLISTGIPIFDASGVLKRVISFAKDVSELELVTLRGGTTASLPGSPAPHQTEIPLVCASIAMRRCMDVIGRAAKTDVTILLLGETGVGKNRMAKYLHDMSHRASGPFLEINCAAIPESLLESELFGYERGSFTGARQEGKPGKVELANRGTLFLNEIGELPLSLQGKLLDLLQKHAIERIGGTKPVPVDIRVVAATNRNLEEMVEQGQFRADLYYRLNVIPVTIPPLRSRPEDIQPLVHAYVDLLSQRYHIRSKTIDPECLTLFQRYAWPGNIRELENLLERLVVTVNDEVIRVHHLPNHMLRRAGHGNAEVAFANAAEPKLAASQGEYEQYAQACSVCSTTREVARLLGVSQSTVVRKLRKYGLTLSRAKRSREL